MLRRLVPAFIAALLAAFAQARAAEPYVPPVLEPWTGWVLHGEEARICPGLPGEKHGQERLCAWPGPLQLELAAGGGRFRQAWTVYAETWLPLPGGEHWPQAVSANDRPVPVTGHAGGPALRLPAGEYRIAGRFDWPRQPESLRVPAATALVELSMDGKPVAWPERDGEALWLGRRKEEKKEAESLSVEVFRLLADGHPLSLETRLALNVSGPGREVLLERVLLQGFLPTGVGGELPARLEADGRLRLQLRPGSWTVSVTARAAAPLAELSLPAGEGAKEEIWSFRSDERVRMASLEGAPAVDPGEAGVPGEWQSLAAYRVLPGQRLKLVERSRGLASQDANQLSLNRQLWLGFAGDEFVFQDRVQGRMNRGWRMDMAAPYRLRQARAGGEELLVTEGGEGRTGVELREARLDLEALGTVARAEAGRATGWDELFDGVDTVLNLPPGYRLIAAAGADAAPEAWLSRWSLLDFFLLLIIAVALGKLLGWPWAAASLVLLGLSVHEPDAPRWSWLNLAAAVALVRYLPDNRFRRYLAGYRNASFLAVALLGLFFAALQLRLSLYPQLELEHGVVARGHAGAERGLPAASAPAPAEEALMMEPRLAKPALPGQKQEAASDEVERIEVTGRRMRAMDRVSRYAADAKIQTGPGLPSWSWGRYHLSWSGPVSAEQALDLTILPPAGLAGFRLLAVALLALLLAQFARQCFPGPRWPRWLGGQAAALALAAVLLAPGGEARAESVPPKPEPPSAALLAELKRRLLAPPPCHPACVELPAARIEATPEALSLTLDVAAQARVPVAVPGTLDGWRPRQITAGGKAQPVLRERDSFWVLAEPGLSRIVLTGPMPPADSVQLRFPAKPRLLSARAEGWELGGLVDGLLQGEHLEFSRLKSQGAGVEGWAEMSTIPAFVIVRRELLFDREFRVRTRVTRRAPAQAPIALAIPLLAGEAVQTAEAKMADGQVLVSLPAGVDEFAWESTLPRHAELKLTAEASADYVEQWRYVASPSLHVEHAGVPVLAQDPAQGEYNPEFYPLPGETLSLKITRPAASEGDTLALDGVSFSGSVGQRATELALSLNYRSSRGGQHELVLPVDAEVSAVLADGQRLGLRPERGRLLLPVQPGAHSLTVNWRQGGEPDLSLGLPAVDLRHAASNLELVLNLPADRWILFTGGPRLGPAVLYWGELAVFALVAFALGRTRVTPLKARHWLLLGLGLSTLAWPTLALVTAWLFALAWRGGRGAELGGTRFNLTQLGLGLLSLLALGALVAAIPQALLSSPDMHILGNGSYGGQLRWFADQAPGSLPEIFVLSLPLWVYRVAMLAWSLWLSLALIRWLRWGWTAYSAGGVWQARAAKPAAVPARPNTTE